MPEVIEKSAWVHLHAGRLLAVRSHGRTRFYLPGGKPEPGESPQQALVREIAEELGVALDPATVVPVAVLEAPADGKASGTVVRTSCFTATGSGRPTPSAEIAELAWLSHGDRHRVSASTAELLDRLAATGGLLRW
ncbi:NUDIX hydrolase [Kitasatospora sp. LaBMicrA B282]|uniref:NUDIX hydrolase n=1 Tax=Kitasatospora sp. LaBMicrA B282 TaxID=3420949 RepID=UPI003D139674